MKSTVDKVAECVMEYFMKEDPTQIPHTQCVASYTHYIAFCENLPEHESGLIEMAAWMHDIGCPESKKNMATHYRYIRRKREELWPVSCSKILTDLLKTKKHG